MSSENPESDAALESVLRSSKNIDQFLEYFFSFLARRTDFFIEQPPEGGHYGFPKGHAEAKINSQFKRWQKRCKLSQPPSGSKDVAVPVSSKQAHAPQPPQPSGPLGVSLEVGDKDGETKAVFEIEPGQDLASMSVGSSVPSPAVATHDDYNGRVTDNYSWSQTIGDIDVKVPVSKEVQKGKQVKVSIGTGDVRVEVSDRLLFEGKFPFPVRRDESYWNLVPGESIRIWIQKAQERWWPGLLEGEEPLDMSKIEAVRPMEDLPDEEQMKLQELCWNETRKRQGLPTSEQLKIDSALRKAWNAEDSPFKGQPYDPNMLQMMGSK